MIAGYYNCPIGCSGNRCSWPCSGCPSANVVVIGVHIMEQMAIDVAKEFDRVWRLYFREFPRKTRRKRNKSTVPTALLTPRCPRLGCTYKRPTQKASSYG